MKHVAVFLRSGALGDQILFFPVLAALRQQMPDARIVFWTNSGPIAPVALSHHLADEVRVGGAPLVDPVIWLQVADGQAHWELIDRPDMAFAYVLDMVGLDPKREELAAYCDIHISHWLNNTPMPQIERFMTPLWQAGYQGFTHQTWGTIDRRLNQKRSRLAVVHPGAGQSLKCWPYYDQLIRRLQERGYEVAVTCGPNDLQTVYRLPIDRGLIREKLSLPALEALLQSAQVYIGNDTGVTHLAAFLGTPTVAIFGPTDPAIWAPAGPRVRVLRECDEHDDQWILLLNCQRHDCIRRVSVNRVLGAVDEVVQEAGCSTTPGDTLPV